jgi:hypothetical protein
VSWLHINLLGGCEFSGGKFKDSVRIKPQNWRPEGGLILEAAKRTYLVVYIWLVVNRVAF